MPLDRQISMEEAAIKYSGELDKPDGISDVTGPCGDKMGFSLVVSQGRISAIKFRATGCSVTQACGAVVAFTADQLSLSEALFISPGYITRTLGAVPPDHRHCPILAANAFYRAVADYYLKTEMPAKDDNHENRK